MHAFNEQLYCLSQYYLVQEINKLLRKGFLNVKINVVYLEFCQKINFICSLFAACLV